MFSKHKSNVFKEKTGKFTKKNQQNLELLYKKKTLKFDTWLIFNFRCYHFESNLNSNFDPEERFDRNGYEKFIIINGRGSIDPKPKYQKTKISKPKYRKAKGGGANQFLRFSLI